MDDTESKEAVDESEAAPHLSKSPTHSDTLENSNESAGPQSRPYTAIERQIAAASTLGHGSPTPHITARARDRRRKNDRRKINRFGFGSFLVLLWLAVIGLITAFTDFGQVLQRSQALQKKSIDVPPASQAPSSNVAQTAVPNSVSENLVPGNLVSENLVSENAALEKSNIGALSIPITDISLRTRPELVEQLVQVYRSQLVANPNDMATRAALDQLQERSLSDIQTLIAEGYVSTASRLLEIVSRWFPELTDNVRYKYLLARTEYMRREVKDEPIVKTNQPAPAVSSPISNTSPVVKTSAPVATPNTPVTGRNTPVTASNAPVATNNTSENIASSKPEIRSVSIVPGAMVDDNFVPRDGGNVFMVEISYRNFERVFEGNAAATLVTLLAEPDDPMVLAEVPIIITADRGTKSFVMETNNVQGYAGGKFQLNFMLNDEFLTSRTLRLSRP